MKEGGIEGLEAHVYGRIGAGLSLSHVEASLEPQIDQTKQIQAKTNQTYSRENVLLRRNVAETDEIGSTGTHGLKNLGIGIHPILTKQQKDKTIN